MWTLVFVALAALLWLFRVTFGAGADESIFPWLGWLNKAALGMSLLAGVQLVLQILRHLLRAPRGGRAGGATDLLHSALTMTLYVGAILLFLHAGLGVDITSVLATSAILSIIIGLALQPTLGHLFAGVSIEIERPLRVGDYVRREQVEGRVVSLNWRSVYLRTDRGSVVVLPNSEFTGRLLEIIPSGQPFRHDVPFTVSSEVAPGRVIRIASQVLASALPGVADEPRPSVILKNNDPVTGTLGYVARFHTLQFLERRWIASGFLERLWYALAREGVALPTPPAFVQSLADDTGRPVSVAPARAPMSASLLASGLAPDIADVLQREGLLLPFGYREDCPADRAFVVLHGRVREARPTDHPETQQALAELLAALERGEGQGQPERLERRHVQALHKVASFVLGPVAADLCQRLAVLTDDPWLAYHALAATTTSPESRARLLEDAPQCSYRMREAGQWLGWERVLRFGGEVPVRHAMQDTLLMVWDAPALGRVAQALAPSAQAELVAFLRRTAPGCAELPDEALARLAGTVTVAG